MQALEPLTCSVSTASNATGLSVRRLYELIEQKRLRAVKLDGRRLVDVSSLRELVGANRDQAGS